MPAAKVGQGGEVASARQPIRVLLVLPGLSPRRQGGENQQGDQRGSFHHVSPWYQGLTIIYLGYLSGNLALTKENRMRNPARKP